MGIKECLLPTICSQFPILAFETNAVSTAVKTLLGKLLKLWTHPF